MSDNDLMMSAAHGLGVTICGIAPATKLATIDKNPCTNCGEVQVVRLFSGSGWYEDHFICRACGENVGTGYRPFKRAWRKANISKADIWAESAIPNDKYFARTWALIKEEMDFPDEPGLMDEGVSA